MLKSKKNIKDMALPILKEHSSLFSVNEPKELEGFNCGDLDINEFFANDCFGFTKLMF